MNSLNVSAARAVGQRMRIRAGRLACILLAAQFTTACVVPGSMHVTEGIAPQKIDTLVRFRTTYYFRVFDYCWAADTVNGAYRRIVPETDTLYRYRMTGKAPSLTNKIKFESGILDANTINPFGADVVYNNDINGYLVRSPKEALEQAKAVAADRAAQAARDSALDRFQTLATMLQRATAAGQTVEAEQIKLAMKDALQDFTGTLRAPLNDEVKTRLQAIETALKEITTKLAAPPPTIAAGATPVELEAARKVFAQEVSDQITALRTEIKGIIPQGKACTTNDNLTRGFQIMGPEGMRPFDQKERLVMAMSSSAKPLIETLNEYSGRILKPQVNPAEQLLPLARETTSVVDAQRAVYQEAIVVGAKDATKPRLSTLFDEATKAFTPGAK